MHSEETRPGRGLALASLSVSAVGVVLALSTWAAWLLVLPRMVDGLPYRWITAVFLLVLGALWFAVLPIGVLGVIFGLVSGARSPDGDTMSRAGAFLGLFALAVAVAGAAVFVFGSPDLVPTGAEQGLFG